MEKKKTWRMDTTSSFWNLGFGFAWQYAGGWPLEGARGLGLHGDGERPAAAPDGPPAPVEQPRAATTRVWAPDDSMDCEGGDFVLIHLVQS